MNKTVPPPVPIPQPPAPPPGLAADVVASGLPVHPEDRVRLFNDKQWELFVQEWVDSLEDQYDLVERCRSLSMKVRQSASEFREQLQRRGGDGIGAVGIVSVDQGPLHRGSTPSWRKRFARQHGIETRRARSRLRVYPSIGADASPGYTGLKR